MIFSNFLITVTLLFTFQTIVHGGGGDYSNPSDKFKSCSSDVKVKPAEFVDLHNKARKSVGAGSVSWDQGLANTAQCWANRCIFEHSHTQGFGENIAAGSGPYSDQNAFVDWWEEYKLYNKGDDYSEPTGHYTQIAWKGTKKIGCGSALCSSRKLGLGGTYTQARFVVCEYFPQGNILGTFGGQVNLPSYDPMAHMGDYGQDDYANKFNDDTDIGTGVPPKNKTSTGNTSKPKTKQTPTTGTTTGSGNQGKNSTITGGSGGNQNTPTSSPSNGSGSSTGGCNNGTCSQGGNDDYSSGDASGNCTTQKPTRKHKHNHHGHTGGHHKHKPKANSRHSTNSGSGANPPAPAPMPVTTQSNDDYQPSDDNQSTSQATDAGTAGSNDSQPPADDQDSGSDSQSSTSVNSGNDDTQDDTNTGTGDYQQPPSQDNDQSNQPTATDQDQDQDDYGDDSSDDYTQSSQDDDDDYSGGPISISIGRLNL